MKVINILLCAAVIVSCGKVKEDDGDFESGKSFSFANTTEKKWTGSGDKVEQDIDLNEGGAVFEYEYKGEGNFIVWLTDSNGENVDLIANIIGKGSGSVFVEIPEDGKYSLEVDASGEWTVKTVNPTFDQELPEKINGAIPNVSYVYPLEASQYVFAAEHFGEHNFIVWAHDAASGERLDLLFNEIGKYEGEAALNLDESTYVIFGIDADGAWTLTKQ